jgi:hypothetical protein
MPQYFEWIVECPHCGKFTQIQPKEPVICPKCFEPDIEVEPSEELKGRINELSETSFDTGDERSSIP